MTDLSKYHRPWVRWGNGTGTHAHLLNLVGFNKRVLEVGCATGYLSRVMQERGCRVTGVEVDEAAAEHARPFCERVIVGDVETLDWASVLGKERFDAITCGDVLEHLQAPDAVLRILRPYLVPGGYLVASLPNIAHGSVRLSLLLGRFDYGSLGILDETHLHFYTRQTAEQLLRESGWRVKDVVTVEEPIPGELIQRVSRRFRSLGSDWIQELLAGQDAQAFQYIFCAIPEEETEAPQRRRRPAEHLIPSTVVYHRGDDARLATCLERLAWDGQQIIVASETEPIGESVPPLTERRWQEYRPGEHPARVMNEAVASATGDVVLLVDSEVRVGGDSVAALVRRFEMDQTVGIVGGQVLDADGRTVVHAGAFLAPPVARISYRWNRLPIDERRSNAAEVDFVPWNLMAVRRSMWRDLGGFDERFHDHYFDADLCQRAWRAGWRVLVAPDVRVVGFSSAPRQWTDRVEFHRDRLRFVRLHYAAQRWPADFLEAELSLLDSVQSPMERQAMGCAYLWHLVEGENKRKGEIRSLSRLYEYAKASGMVDPPTVVRLETHRFRSRVAWVGGLIARFRAAWGAVAARWYAESLANQQNAINQALAERMDDLQDQISELEKLILSLGADQTE